mgnify:CR=1 FL=1
MNRARCNGPLYVLSLRVIAPVSSRPSCYIVGANSYRSSRQTSPSGDSERSRSAWERERMSSTSGSAWDHNNNGGGGSPELREALLLGDGGSSPESREIKGIAVKKQDDLEEIRSVGELMRLAAEAPSRRCSPDTSPRSRSTPSPPRTWSSPASPSGSWLVSIPSVSWYKTQLFFYILHNIKYACMHIIN